MTTVYDAIVIVLGAFSKSVNINTLDQDIAFMEFFLSYLYARHLLSEEDLLKIISLCEKTIQKG